MKKYADLAAIRLTHVINAEAALEHFTPRSGAYEGYDIWAMNENGSRYWIGCAGVAGMSSKNRAIQKQAWAKFITLVERVQMAYVRSGTIPDEGDKRFADCMQERDRT